MKKFDIIVEYNSLESELRTAVANYNAVTGENYEDKFNFCIFKTLGSNCMSWSKDELENCLSNRQRLIANCKRDTEVYQKTKEMESTEEGQAFIRSLEDAKAEAENGLNKLSDSFHKEFKKLLNSIGMDDWSLNPNKKIIPKRSYNSFSIYNRKDTWCHMSICIRYSGGMWLMDPGMSLSSHSNEIGDRDFQYLICKGFTTLCENSHIIHAWLKDTYEPMVHTGYDLTDTIDRLNDKLENPYDAWLEKK